MAVPVLAAAGTAAQDDTTSPLALPYPSGISAGHLLIAHVIASDTGAPPAPSSGTPSGFTELTNWDSGTFEHHKISYKFASGSESGTVNVSFSGGSQIEASGRMYRFTGCDTIVSGGGYDWTSGAPVGDDPVTNPGGDALAVNLIAADSDSSIGSLTGETGGDWTEAYTFQLTSGPTGGLFASIQTASMTAAGTITGGTVGSNRNHSSVGLLLQDRSSAVWSTWRKPGTGTNQARSGSASSWTSPGNITADDTSDATIDLGKNDYGDYLRGDNFGWSAEIGASDVIYGIEFRFFRGVSGGTWDDEELYLIDAAGLQTGSNMATGVTWPTTAALSGTVGGESDDWGATPTATMVRDADFGVEMSPARGSGGGGSQTGSVDYYEMRLFYLSLATPASDVPTLDRTRIVRRM